jgi:hypothetical protein
MLRRVGARRRWSYLLGIGPVLLLFALAPSLLYVGHWGSLLSGLVASPPAALEGSSEHEDHAGHCHYGPSACSDQPAPVGVQVLPLIVEMVHPELASTVMEETAPLLEEVLVAPPVEPPRL